MSLTTNIEKQGKLCFIPEKSYLIYLFYLIITIKGVIYMLRIILLILAVSTDGFASAIGLGSAGIKVPFRSAAVISTVGTAFLTLSVCFADVLERFIPVSVCGIISSAVLILLGIFNLLHGVLKRKTLKNQDKNTAIAVFFDGTKADTDHSKTISCKEALLLSAALSADSLVMGISAGLGEIMLVPLIVLSFAMGLGAVMGGAAIGKRMISGGDPDLQWLCGIILIVLAFIA